MCVEEVIIGKMIIGAVDELWMLITQNKTDVQSLYKQLVDIIDREQPNYVLSINILDLYKSITLVYYYSGEPFLFTNVNQMTIVESGVEHLWSINPPTTSQLKKICEDENMLQISNVDVKLLFLACVKENALAACVDEPFVLTAAFNFFKDYDSLPKDILNMMFKANNTIAENEDLPHFCVGSPKIVKSSKDNIPLAANATAGYTLDMFFNELPKLRPAFYFPDDRYGPDIIFFVKFENNVSVSVFVQVKLCYSMHTIAGALSTIDPKMFYKDKNGKIFQEGTTKPIINKIIKWCEEFGSIGLLVAYPADLCQESFVTNNHLYNLRNRSRQRQLIGIIDHENASE
ncbi:32828_t:CDS:2, partial [Gigaspora margarita]